MNTEYQPTEYDQHVRYADNETDRARSNIGEDGPATGLIFATLAVAEATLAAAEQARIGNLIAIARYNTDEINRGAEGGLTATVDQMARLADLQEVIRDALGLPSPWTEQSGPPLRNPPEPAPDALPAWAEKLGHTKRVAVEMRLIGQAHTFDTDAERDYRVLFLTEVIEDTTESHLHERARTELAEYRKAGE